jgi:hypothetical protein
MDEQGAEPSIVLSENSAGAAGLNIRGETAKEGEPTTTEPFSAES